jgi:outer membrane receptor protein involved in Fe transport
MGKVGLSPRVLIRQALFASRLLLSSLKPRRNLLLCLAIAAIMDGQQPSGEIRLAVEDSSGAAMQASGTLDENAFQTDGQGKYDFHNLAPGRHRLVVSRPGFATQVISVEVGQRSISEIVKLEVASSATSVDVVDTTPLAGANVNKDQIAAPVQTATADDVDNSGALDLSDFLNRRMNGVYLNENQGNPFQPDVNFRGYTASPLLGTPEGISVYLDGVRQNQPFGDVVAWDLIPKNAIAEMSLVPGSDPLFGLNTLGGAISVQTKDGVRYPGLSGALIYGSSGRKEVDATWGGGKATGFNWFLAGTGFHESGWRYDSPSDVRQGFVRLGWRTDKTDLALTTTYAYNTLLGNGIQDYRLLAANYTSTYTPGDSIANRAPMFNFIARHTFSDKLTFSGNAWFRNIRTESINPNFNTDVLGNDIYQPTADEQATLAAAGYTGFPASGANPANTPFPYWSCLAEAISHGNPDGTCDGVTIYGKEVQNDFGFSGQFTWVASSPVGRNQLSAGFLWDHGSVDFTQNTAYGYVNPNYTITSVAAWQDGSTGVDSRVNLHGVTPNWSPYFSDTLTLPKHLNLTVSGRFNRFTVNNTDNLIPLAGPGSLTGDYVFQRFNPSVGLTWSPVSSVNAYARFSQGSRAPTAIELGCADPANPCALPNALSSDPPLQQVVNDTWEVGLRGKPEVPFMRNLNWNVGAFRGENHNDILFVSSVLLGTGYFQNFAKTLREGFDADLDGRIGRVTWGLDYTFLSATYQSTEVLNGSGNSSSDSALAGYPGLDGNIYVHPGNRIPLIPKNTGKAWLNYQITKNLVFDLDEIVISSSYARGNENNAYQADGVYYLGPGVSPGYAVTNFHAHYDLTKRLQLGVEVDNLFDKHYYTAAQLAITAFTAQGTVQTLPFPAYTEGPYAGSAPGQSATFFAPGAPRRAWVELRAHF